MSKTVGDSVSELSAIIDQTPIDWDAFSSVLKGLEDINLYDNQYEETILSEFLMSEGLYCRGTILRMRLLFSVMMPPIFSIAAPEQPVNINLTFVPVPGSCSRNIPDSTH